MSRILATKEHRLPDICQVGCLGSFVVFAPSMRSGCRGFESRSGHLIFSSICSVYIDRHIRVDLSDDEQCSKYAVLRTMCMVYTSGPMSMCLDDQQK